MSANETSKETTTPTGIQESATSPPTPPGRTVRKKAPPSRKGAPRRTQSEPREPTGSSGSGPSKSDPYQSPGRIWPD